MGGIREEARGHSVGLTTPVVPLLGRLAHLAKAVHLVIVKLTTTLLAHLAKAVHLGIVKLATTLLGILFQNC